MCLLPDAYFRDGVDKFPDLDEPFDIEEVPLAVANGTVGPAMGAPVLGFIGHFGRYRFVQIQSKAGPVRR